MEALPAKSRRLIDLAYEQRLRGAGIARELQMSRDAVYKSLARIRAKLEACIRKKLASP